MSNETPNDHVVPVVGAEFQFHNVFQLLIGVLNDDAKLVPAPKQHNTTK